MAARRRLLPILVLPTVVTAVAAVTAVTAYITISRPFGDPNALLFNQDTVHGEAVNVVLGLRARM